jgi:hypothetical protein
VRIFPRNEPTNPTEYPSERPEITSYDEERNKAKPTKGKIESTKGKKMNLKKQIAVIVLALTATTSPVWSQDRQPLASPTAHNLQGTWRAAITAVDCVTGQDLVSFPAIMTFNQGGTCSEYFVVPGNDSGQETQAGVWQREPGSQNYSVRTVGYAYTAEGVFAGRAEITRTLHLTSANSFESSSIVQIFDADGNLVFTACERGTGERFQ